jgi:hypothetical protein
MAHTRNPQDPFFGPTDDRQWNACIGRQGHELNYVDGFIEAAMALVSAVIDKQMFEKRDTLVLPILYNARHAVELTLKFVLKKLNDAGMAEIAFRRNHDIRTQWEQAHAASQGDETLRLGFDALHPYIVSLAAIDSDGQELRYAQNQEGKRSLEAHAIANLQLIRTSLERLGGVLTQLKNRTLDLVEERRTGSHTAACSRRDLLQIAGMLPAKANWGGPEFLPAKEAVMKRFNLSSRKFSEALKVIENHREMGQLVGIESALHHLCDDHLVFAVERWSTLHPPRSADEGRGGLFVFGHRDRTAMIEHDRKADQVNANLLSTMSEDELAELETVYYLGRDRRFCEDHEHMLRNTKIQKRMDGHLINDVDNLMEKTNFVQAVALGLVVLGRPNLAARIRAIRPDCV